MLAGQLLRPWLQHLHTLGFVGLGGNCLKCTMCLKGKQQSERSISSPFRLKFTSKRYRRQLRKTSTECPLKMGDNIHSHFSGSKTPSCFANPWKIFLLLFFLRQLKCQFSVHFPYLFYNAACCEPASYSPLRSQFPDRTTLLITFLWKMLKANTDTESDLDVDVHTLLHTHGDAFGEGCAPQHQEKGTCSFWHGRIR